MRRVIALPIIVGVLVAGDFALKAFAEAKVAGAIQSSFASDGAAEVSFSGFPFVAALLKGSITTVGLSSSALGRDGLRLTDVEMTLDDVSFSWSKVLAGEIGSVSIRSGSGSASIPANALVRAMSPVSGDVGISVDGGKVRVSAGGARATGTLDIEGTDLVLRVPALGRRFEAPLPRFVSGLQYRSVEIDGNEAVVSFSLRSSNLRQI